MNYTILAKGILLILGYLTLGVSFDLTEKPSNSKEGFFVQSIALLKNQLKYLPQNVKPPPLPINTQTSASENIAAAVSYENTTAVSFVGIECATVATSTINVPDNLIITDINIGFNSTIVYRHHVTVTLESPSGTIVELTSNIAYTGASASISNWDVLFDEASANILNDGDSDVIAAPNYENERIANPSGNLDNFNGENSSGAWKLHVCDFKTTLK